MSQGVNAKRVNKTHHLPIEGGGEKGLCFVCRTFFHATQTYITEVLESPEIF